MKIKYLAKSIDLKKRTESENFPHKISHARKNNEKLRKPDKNIKNNDYHSEIPTPKSTLDKQRDNLINKESYKYNKIDYHEGSISEHEREFRSNNFLNLKSTLTPLKKELNRSQSPHYDNDYMKLDKQIKEMQNQINSMNTDFTINRCLTSKSFGLLFNGKNTLEKTNSNYVNPFIENLNKNEIPDSYQIAHSKKDEGNIKITENFLKDNIQNNNLVSTPIIEKRPGPENNQNSNRKESNSISYIGQNVNMNEQKLPKKIQITENENENINKNKIQNIEEKLERMENDISEMKGNFNKLYESIIKLLDFAYSKNNINNYPNQFGAPNMNFNKNENYYNQNDPSNIGTREYLNLNPNNLNNNNEANNSQRLNTQNSKISSNQTNPIQNPVQNNNFVHSTNSVANSNNDALNFILAECNKLKNLNHNNRDFQQDTYYNNNFNSNLINPNYDSQEVNYFESPRNYRNEILMNSNSINLPYNDIPTRKNLINTNYRRNNKMIDNPFQNEEDSNNFTPNLNFENSNLH